MDPLLPIGRFSQLTRLSVKALRLYDARGLLRPALVDLQTGFRYYDPAQSARAARIRLLRSIEMPLDEIGGLLAERDSGAQRARLAAHHKRIEERLLATRQALVLLQTLEERIDEQEATAMPPKRRPWEGWPGPFDEEQPRRTSAYPDDRQPTNTRNDGHDGRCPDGNSESEDSDVELQSAPYRCSFCGKSHDEVKRLIAGPKLVFICDECVARCNEILAREAVTTQPSQ